MKKLVFAAIAAMVMVSVSNVFASNKMASVSSFCFTGDQRWNCWGRGREGGKALFTFLPFYFFTFKSF